jgi:hypothetical protein
MEEKSRANGIDIQKGCPHFLLEFRITNRIVQGDYS